MQEITIKLPQLNKVLTSKNIFTVFEILKQEKIMTYTPCGGKGKCGKCKIRINGIISDVSEEEKKYLSKEEINKGFRLACSTYVNDKAIVHLIKEDLYNNAKEKLVSIKHYSINSDISKIIIQPELPSLTNNYSLIECITNKIANVRMSIDIIKKTSESIDYLKQVTLTLYENELIDIENENTKDKNFGVAIDLGTTTIACYLVDLNSGKQIEALSMQNPQTNYGADVVSRIAYCIENKNGLAILNKEIKKAIDKIIYKITKKANIQKRYIYKCVLVGNTVMQHLFWKLNPISLAKLPFNPVTKGMIIQDASLVQINNVNKKGKIIFLPSIGGFIGSDITSGIISANLANSDDIKIFIDLGTNGEIVLFTPRGIYACSTAAGPAFEGAKIKNGMQAFSGAINSAWVEDDLHYTTINNKTPKGICGSGLIDIISGLLQEKVITKEGKIVNADTLINKKLIARILMKDRVKEIIIVRAKEAYNNIEIIITQQDVRAIQLAKGAIKAGINILLKIANVKVDEVNKIILAGAFGNFINKENARNIGLFPYISLDKILSIGNAAGEGAMMALCDKNVVNKEIKKYLAEIRHVQISIHPDFQKEFINGMCFDT